MNRSTLRRAAALVAVPATIALFAAPAAWAQDAALTVTGSEGTCGRTTLTATAPAGVYEIAVYSGPNAGGVASDPLGQFTTSPDGPVSHTFTLPEDAYDGSGFVSWATISGPEQNSYVHGAIGVDTDCAPPVEEEPEPTPDPEPEPEPSVEPDPTVDPDPTVTDQPDPTSTQPAPDSTEPAAPTSDTDSTVVENDADIDAGVYYENCAAARDAGVAPLYATDDGYRAGLDSDGDGEACEGGTLYNPSGDESFSQTGDVPIGSAETGAA